MKNYKKVEPRLCKFKNREEFLAYIDTQYQAELKQIAKQKAEYQASIKAKYFNKKSQFDQHRENNSLVDNYNAHYEKVREKPPKMSEEELKKRSYKENKGFEKNSEIE